jgi:hypothetical protein
MGLGLVVKHGNGSLLYVCIDTPISNKGGIDILSRRANKRCRSLGIFDHRYGEIGVTRLD